MTTMARTRDRLDQTQSMLARNDLDLLIASPGSDLAYIIGYLGHASERPAILIIPKEGPSTMVMAYFESLSLPDLGGRMQVRSYTETQDGFNLVADTASSYASQPIRIAVSDQIWGRFLLRLQKIFSAAEFVNASTYLRELRMRKDARELQLMRNAGSRADGALARLLEDPLAGQTEKQVGLKLAGHLQEVELENPFSIVGSGPNGASPHHLNSDRRIESGDTVVIDFGGSLDGYWADMTRTVCVGSCHPEVRTVYEIVSEAQEAGVNAMRAGTRCESVDQAARSIIESAGYGDAFIHRTGHGIGLDVHEDPYNVKGSSIMLEPGMVTSIEPGIYLDGRFGVRIEDIVAVTETGPERLNSFRRDLMIVA